VAPSGVWLRQDAYRTDRVMLPEKPLSVWKEATPRRPVLPPLKPARFTQLRLPGGPTDQLARVEPWARPRAVRRQAVNSRTQATPGTGEAWTRVRSGHPPFSPSSTSRYSVAHASAERQWVVTVFGVLVSVLTVLVTVILIRLLSR
jgi:hypothetical protein